ncbi:hypothetical protein THAOC_04447 [Thalassiosira oceanica]|uniref:MYND-type domain-containing protein n=1 Tax=Thalassiosira oceanica TaxID=159749 RepID=K0T8K3_THAOC|nr:hypothetical protein THAOC_04447 [Thalassiosira oceanica]|eukprot:EJK73910.1 hypothetical protein THAOC_04447 [Thalassiosira oceanica]
MSCVPVAADGDEACANCGKQGSDTIKLKSCTACRLVKYCGVDCQRAHRKQHKKACKQRAAELKDQKLYSQGHERPEGDFCPICTLPIPTRYPDDDADALAMTQRRVAKKDPDEAKAVEFYKKAAMQGSVDARHNLGCIETEKGNHDRALRHFLISAKMGHKNSLEAIKKRFTAELATKEQYAQALKGYQEALEEMKSHDRDEAKRLRDEQGL